MFRQIDRHTIYVAALVVGGIALGTFFGLWRYSSYRASTDISILIDRLNKIEVQMVKDHSTTRTELDELYRVVYGTVPAKIAKGQSSVEAWQRNRDQELRDRIRRLEEWRFKVQ